MKTILYHNQNCSKSCAVYTMVSELAPHLEVINYLEQPPSKTDLKEILSLLKISAFELIRQNEPIFLQHFSGKQFSEEERIDVLVENPVLIERPIVIHGNQAAVGRPIERVLSLFQSSKRS